MSKTKNTLILATLVATAVAAAPELADACGGGYQLSPEQVAAMKAARAERQRLAKLRKTRARQCVVGRIQKIRASQRESFGDLPADAEERRTVFMSYPLYSGDGYQASVYGAHITLNHVGVMYGHYNSGNQYASATLTLRPDGRGEWMEVRDFAAECPQASEGNHLAMHR